VGEYESFIWEVALEVCVEQPNGVEVKLKILSGGTRMCKGLLRIRKKCYRGLYHDKSMDNIEKFERNIDA
jgi:hypothetical protein